MSDEVILQRLEDIGRNLLEAWQNIARLNEEYGMLTGKVSFIDDKVREISTIVRRIDEMLLVKKAQTDLILSIIKYAAMFGSGALVVELIKRLLGF